MQEMNDYELVAKCLEGRQDSFEELVTRYKRLVYSVVSRYTHDREEIDDICQEVFLRIYKSLGTYNPQYRFSTWAVRIASNLCVDMMRKKKITSLSIDEIAGIAREDDTPEKRYIKSERSLEIRRAISQLPDAYRIPVILFHQKGLSYKEIAERLNKPMSIIKNRLYRARLSLRESLTGAGV